MANQVVLDGKVYTTVVDGRENPLIRRSSRPSQPSDAGAMRYAEWQTWGHDFESFERISGGQEAGFLGRDWGEGTDGRWFGLDTLGPKVNVIDQSAYDNDLQPGLLGGGSTPGMIIGGGSTAGGGIGPGQSVENSKGFASIRVAGTTYGYVPRGTAPAKIDLSDMTTAPSGLTLTRPATDIIATSPESASVRAEVSIAQGADPYVVLQQANVGDPPTADTWLTNQSNEPATILGQAPDSVALIHGTTVKRNIQTGTVTMEDPNWLTVTDELPNDVESTGFAIDGNLWVLGTADGPLMLDANTRKFFPIMPELSLSEWHCRNMAEWFPVGVVIPLEYAIRFQKYGSGKSFGSETFKANTSPVQGTPTAWTASEREGYEIRHNPATDESFLVAWREPEVGDGSGYEASLLAPYVIAHLDGIASEYLAWLGTVDGLRTNPTLLGGHDSDSFWLTCGRTARWIDDANYEYTASGTTNYTELRRLRNLLADVEYVELEVRRSDGGALDANKSVTFQLAFDSGIESGTYTTIGSAVTTAGFVRLIASSNGVPQSAFHGVHRMKPRALFATDDDTVAPQILGPFRVYYRTRPTTIQVQVYTLELTEDGVSTPREKEDALRALISDEPVEFQDAYSQTYYVRVTGVEMSKVNATGQGRDSDRGLRSYVDVTLEEWTVA